MTELRMRPNEGEPWHPLQVDMQPHPYPGNLIVFEGVDGAGKSTLLSMLAEYLGGKVPGLTVTKTPSDDVRQMWAWRAWSDGSYGIPRDELHGYGLSIIAFGDRLVHQRHVVEPALRRGDWVICDRYVITSVAYECSSVHAELGKLLIRPDLGFLAHVDPGEAVRRLRKRDYEDEHPEDESDIHMLSDRFVTLAKLNGHHLINTYNQTPAESFRQMLPHVERLLPPSSSQA